MDRERSDGYLQEVGTDWMTKAQLEEEVGILLNKLYPNTKEKIEEEIDWLLDDNHVCLCIMQDESSSYADALEAESRLRDNNRRIADLRNQRMQLMRMEDDQK